MNTFVADTYHLTVRHVRTTMRIPVWIFVTLTQPIIWLALYGQLFRRIIDIPGFETDSYIQFLTPGVVVMTAFFGSAWSGMGLIEDLKEGIMDRLLATPIHRGAIIASRVLHASLTVVVQSAIILVFGIVLGARIPGGVAGGFAILLMAVMLGAGMAAISAGVALLTRREETLIAIINFFGLPLIFLSTAFIAADLMPGWIKFVAQGNPVNWAVNGSRNAMQGQNWLDIWGYTALLLGFVLLGIVFATQSFRAYRRTT